MRKWVSFDIMLVPPFSFSEIKRYRAQYTSRLVWNCPLKSESQKWEKDKKGTFFLFVDIFRLKFGLLIQKNLPGTSFQDHWRKIELKINVYVVATPALKKTQYFESPRKMGSIHNPGLKFGISPAFSCIFHGFKQ